MTVLKVEETGVNRPLQRQQKPTPYFLAFPEREPEGGSGRRRRRSRKRLKSWEE